MGNTWKDIRKHGREPRPAGRCAPRSTRCGLTGKRCFPSEAAALARGGEIVSGNPKEADGFRAYRCPSCNQFHLTKHTQRPGLVPSRKPNA